MRRRPGVQQAFDEARFGATRILNVREPMLSSAEAVRRADGWLRAKQVELAGEVLVITGRGKGSPDQVGVVREAVATLLRRLRRAGVVAAVSEHTPGSFAITLSPLRALFDAAPRLRDHSAPMPHSRGRRDPHALSGLEPETRALLRRLAEQSLHALGMRELGERFVEAEMEREFAILTQAMRDRIAEPEVGGQSLTEQASARRGLTEQALRQAISRALAEFEDEEA